MLIETVEYVEDGTRGKIKASETHALMETAEMKKDADQAPTDGLAAGTREINAPNSMTHDGSNDATKDAAGALEIEKEETKVDAVKIDSGDAVGVLATMQSEKISSQYDLRRKEKLDPINQGYYDSSSKVATIVVGSGLVSLSAVANLMANIAQATKKLSVFIGAGCFCCAAAAAEEDSNSTTVCCVISFAAYVLSLVAWFFEKISKFFLKYVHKIILTS